LEGVVRRRCSAGPVLPVWLGRERARSLMCVKSDLTRKGGSSDALQQRWNLQVTEFDRNLFHACLEQIASIAQEVVASKVFTLRLVGESEFLIPTSVHISKTLG